VSDPFAESTYELLTSQDGMSYADELEIRGRTRKLKIWGMVAPAVVEPEPGGSHTAPAQARLIS
jgi:hypothetical protein